jgi:hypothetical protein
MSSTDRAAELERANAAQRFKRYRMRKAGLLPPLPACPQCGAKCTSDRWLPLCSICARRSSWGTRQGCQPREVRLMAEQIIRELRGQR